jgi:plasmid stabilization system protein ParE
VKLKVAKRAEQQADRIEQWWKENRPSAPRIFTEELESTIRLVCEMPGVGVSWPSARRPGIRRVLMPKTEHHVYFRVDEASATVHVLAVWGAPRGTGPKL